MSNQVYSNGQRKYYAQPGSTHWGLLLTQTFPPPPIITSVIFDPVPFFNQGNQLNLRFDPLTNEFVAVEEGLYFLSFLAEAQMSGGTVFEFAIGIQLVTGHGDVDGEPIALWQGATTLSVYPTVYQQISATAYLPQGSTFRVFLDNQAAGTLGLKDATTRLYVTKLA